MKPKDRVKRSIRNQTHVARTISPGTTGSTNVYVDGIMNVFQATVNAGVALIPLLVAEWSIAAV